MIGETSRKSAATGDCNARSCRVPLVDVEVGSVDRGRRRRPRPGAHRRRLGTRPRDGVLDGSPREVPHVGGAPAPGPPARTWNWRYLPSAEAPRHVVLGLACRFGFVKIVSVRSNSTSVPVRCALFDTSTVKNAVRSDTRAACCILCVTITIVYCSPNPRSGPRSWRWPSDRAPAGRP